MSVRSTDEAPTGDVVELLEGQHREVAELFDQLERGTGDTTEPFECLVRLLAVHETAEEEVVYPALRAIGPEGDRIAEARTSEEDEAKKALSELERIGVADQAFSDKLAAFRLLVMEHAGSEEREVFPLLRRALDDDKRRSMRSALEAAERMAPTHPHPHAPESAVGNLVTGPFVAVVDRVRDAIKGAARR